MPNRCDRHPFVVILSSFCIVLLNIFLYCHSEHPLVVILSEAKNLKEKAGTMDREHGIFVSF